MDMSRTLLKGKGFTSLNHSPTGTLTLKCFNFFMHPEREVQPTLTCIRKNLATREKSPGCPRPCETRLRESEAKFGLQSAALASLPRALYIQLDHRGGSQMHLKGGVCDLLQL